MKQFLLLLLCCTMLGGTAMTVHAEDSSLDFFQSLDYDDGVSVIEAVCARFPVQYGTTLGLNGNPQIRPYLQVCVCDPETMTYIRFGGTVNFTDDPDIIERCFAVSEVLTGQFGDNREAVTAYYLTHAWLQVRSFSPEIHARGYVLTNKYD